MRDKKDPVIMAKLSKRGEDERLFDREF